MLSSDAHRNPRREEFHHYSGREAAVKRKSIVGLLRAGHEAGLNPHACRRDGRVKSLLVDGDPVAWLEVQKDR